MTETTALTRADEVASNVSPFEGNGEALTNVLRVANGLAASTIVPKDYQGNVANVMVALEYAHRLKCSVLAVMQNLDVIHGRPSLRATFLIGTVNACERFTPIRFRWIGEKDTDTWGCIAHATDRESGDLCEGPEITIAIAKKEKWWSKPDKNGRETSKWQTIPQLMLMYRAAAWWTRVYSPELSLGLHTTDELEDVSGRAVSLPAERVQAIAQALDAGDDAPVPDSTDELQIGADLQGTLV